MAASGGLFTPSEEGGLGPSGQDRSSALDHIRPPSPTPALAGLAEPEPEEVARSHGRRSPVVGHVAEAILHQTEHHMSDDSDDTEGSLYSDAAEDIARTEGDGFGSIDAVVDSPTVDTTPGIAITTPPESPTKMINGTLARSKDNQHSTVNETETSQAGGWLGKLDRRNVSVLLSLSLHFARCLCLRGNRVSDNIRGRWIRLRDPPCGHISNDDPANCMVAGRGERHLRVISHLGAWCGDARRINALLLTSSDAAEGWQCRPRREEILFPKIGVRPSVASSSPIEAAA